MTLTFADPRRCAWSCCLGQCHFEEELDNIKFKVAVEMCVRIVGHHDTARCTSQQPGPESLCRDDVAQLTYAEDQRGLGTIRCAFLNSVLSCNLAPDTQRAASPSDNHAATATHVGIRHHNQWVL